MDVGSLNKDEIVICVQCLNKWNTVGISVSFYFQGKQQQKQERVKQVVIFSPKRYGWWQGGIKGKEESELKENLILFCSPCLLEF